MSPMLLVTRKILPETNQLCNTMAQEIQSLVREHRGAKPFSIALAGGSTPKRLYETLARPPFLQRIPWEKVAFYFGDERSVPPEHPDSNYHMAKEAMFDRLPSVQVYRMEAEAEDLDASAASYEGLLREQLTRDEERAPVFDLILLGIGNDGHTASLFPGTSALEETQKLVVANDVPQLQTKRMSLTYPLLNAAQRVWILVTGINKRQIVADCLQSQTPEEDRTKWPVLGVQPTSGNLIWWLDRDAASNLSP
ncbi:MAG: 6-phosphogluconolactonase [Myxococcales bacterium]|nr:6-phosphogluconolactonase [Myxococcales bacterium]MCB9644465.1 6-phosphogluconolactonase [Myxococcales bacterium]